MRTDVTRMFTNHFVDREFDSVEEYNAEVLKFANNVREQIAQTERDFLTKMDSAKRILNVKIGGENATED